MEIHDVYDLVKEGSMPLRGVSVKEAMAELKVTERTIHRMLRDGRLEGKKVSFGNQSAWEISPVSIVRLQMEREQSRQKQYRRRI